MKMHIVEGVYNSVQLEDGGLVNTKSEIREGSSEVYKARFYSFEDGTIHKLTLYIVQEILSLILLVFVILHHGNPLGTHWYILNN